MLIDYNCAFSINASIRRKRLDPEWLEREFLIRFYIINNEYSWLSREREQFGVLVVVFFFLLNFWLCVCVFFITINCVKMCLTFRHVAFKKYVTSVRVFLVPLPQAKNKIRGEKKNRKWVTWQQWAFSNVCHRLMPLFRCLKCWLQ